MDRQEEWKPIFTGPTELPKADGASLSGQPAAAQPADGADGCETNAANRQKSSGLAREDIPPERTGPEAPRREPSKRGLRQLYPAAKARAGSFPPPSVGAGEEHILLTQILLCALMLAFVWLARGVHVPFWQEMREQYQELLTAGVDFSTENTFARFAEAVVEDLREGTDRLLRRLETASGPSGGAGGFWPADAKRTVPEGATLEDYTLPIELALPVEGGVTSPYGFRVNPVNGADDFHAGVDIASDEGTPVAAAQSGMVVRTGYSRLRGYYVILRHAGGVQTLYQHLSYIFVRGGETVGQGQIIADVGSTGFVTGPHLHLELILNGIRVDPLPAFPGLAA